MNDAARRRAQRRFASWKIGGAVFALGAALLLGMLVIGTASAPNPSYFCAFRMYIPNLCR